jgi:HSP20 family protein
MDEKIFSVDLGKMMDEAFRVAQEFGEAFGGRMGGAQPGQGFPSPEEMRERFREKFKWHSHSDFYPYYSYPPMNIYLAQDGSLVFEIALAGFEEKDVDLQYRGDYLHFSARAPEQSAEEGVQFFKRRLKLKNIEEQRYYVPEDRFDRDRTEARFHNGLLRVTVPSKESQAQKEGVKVKIVTEEEAAERPQKKAGGKPGETPPQA